MFSVWEILQTSHLSSFHRSLPAPVSMCCSSIYLCSRSPCSKPLGFQVQKMLALLLTWCIVPSLVPSFTGRFAKKNNNNDNKNLNMHLSKLQ